MKYANCYEDAKPKRNIYNYQILKSEFVRPKTAQYYSFKTMAAMLEKKYNNLDRRNLVSAQDKKPSSAKNTNQKDKNQKCNNKLLYRQNNKDLDFTKMLGQNKNVSKKKIQTHKSFQSSKYIPHNENHRASSIKDIQFLLQPFTFEGLKIQQAKNRQSTINNSHNDRNTISQGNYLENTFIPYMMQKQQLQSSLMKKGFQQSKIIAKQAINSCKRRTLKARNSHDNVKKQDKKQTQINQQKTMKTKEKIKLNQSILIGSWQVENSGIRDISGFSFQTSH